MAEPAAWLLYDMIALVIQNTIGTVISLMALFVRFLDSIGFVMGSGFGGFVLGFLVLGVAGFLLAKFVFSSGKTVFALIAIGMVLLVIIYLGMMAMY